MTGIGAFGPDGFGWSGHADNDESTIIGYSRGRDQRATGGRLAERWRGEPPLRPSRFAVFWLEDVEADLTWFVYIEHVDLDADDPTYIERACAAARGEGCEPIEGAQVERSADRVFVTVLVVQRLRADRVLARSTSLPSRPKLIE